MEFNFESTYVYKHETFANTCNDIQLNSVYRNKDNAESFFFFKLKCSYLLGQLKHVPEIDIIL